MKATEKDKERGEKKQDGGVGVEERGRGWERGMRLGWLLANSLLVNPCVYPVECSILPDDGSDKTYGFISKQLLDQTEPGQGHGAARASFSLYNFWKVFSIKKQSIIITVIL